MADYVRVNFDNTETRLTVDYDEDDVATLTQDVIEVLLATSGYYPDAEPVEPEPPGTAETLPA